MEQQYLEHLNALYTRGATKEDRTGTGTASLFGLQMRHDLQKGFPLLTTKKVHLKSIIHELNWMLRGLTNVKWLQERGCTIWDEWADSNGELGPVYGAQWRSWPNPVEFTQSSAYSLPQGHLFSHESNGVAYGIHNKPIDQIANVVQQLKDNPDSRRLIVSAWNPAQVDQMKLPPCHAFFQFYTVEIPTYERYAMLDLWQIEELKAQTPGQLLNQEMLDPYVPRRYLDCQLYQRSADFFLGVPFNIASYSLLTMMMAQQVNMVARDFIWTGGDCHLYTNHFDQAAEQLTRSPYPLPKMWIKRAPAIDQYELEDFELVGYQSHPAIAAPVAV